MGKKSNWRLQEGGSFTAIDAGSEYKYVSDVCHATSIHRKSTIDASRIRDYAREGHIHDHESRILSIDPFNYLDTTVPTNEEISDNPVLNNIDL